VKLELPDIQGIVARGYGTLPSACFVVARVQDRRSARDWLAFVADRVTHAGVHPEAEAVNVAFTADGLRALGMPRETLAGFSAEFAAGMTTEHRGRLLGDVDDSAPERWDWGGPDGEPVHALLMLYADDHAALTRLHDDQVARLEQGGLRRIRTLDTAGDILGREHFGFRDGISQPRIEELSSSPPDAESARAGEFVLGYPNEYGRLTHSPTVAAGEDPDGRLSPHEDPGRRDIGRNGSYLVFRQLRQDVAGFWRFCEEATRTADGRSDAGARLKLAARMVGRWPSGAPLVLTPDADDPSLGEANAFAYHHEDPGGARCPLGSHVRRAHPRDMLDPSPGSEASIAVAKRHRLLRRGRKYGPPVPEGDLLTVGAPAAGEDADRGLHFICLVSNLARQFEFVQHTWLNNPRFAGLYEDPDPLLSPAAPRGRAFTVQGPPVRRRHTGVPRFVTVRGGAYFFLPGVRCLDWLARMP
jgi:Dyp-type peroxidase family